MNIGAIRPGLAVTLMTYYTCVNRECSGMKIVHTGFKGSGIVSILCLTFSSRLDICIEGVSVSPRSCSTLWILAPDKNLRSFTAEIQDTQPENVCDLRKGSAFLES